MGVRFTVPHAPFSTAPSSSCPEGTAATVPDVRLHKQIGTHMPIWMSHRRYFVLQLWSLTHPFFKSGPHVCLFFNQIVLLSYFST